MKEIDRSLAIYQYNYHGPSKSESDWLIYVLPRIVAIKSI